MKNDGPVLRLLKHVAGVPIHAIYGRDISEPNRNPDYRPWLLAADLIFGRDVDSSHEFLVFGRPALEEVRRSGRTGQFRIAVVEVDMETDELEMLLALVRILRGRDDYLSWNEVPPGLRATPEELARWGELPG